MNKLNVNSEPEFANDAPDKKDKELRVKTTRRGMGTVTRPSKLLIIRDERPVRRGFRLWSMA